MSDNPFAKYAPAGADPIVKAAPKPAEKNPYDIQTDQRDFNRSVSNDLVNNEQALRKEFYALPAVKEYQVAARTYANSLQSANDASGDQSLIVAYAKMLDPNSVVREGESAAVAGADSTIGRSIARIGKEFGLSDGGQLSPQIREKIRREMRVLSENYGKAYDQERGQFEQLAQSYGFDSGRIVGPHLMDPYRETVDSYWAARDQETAQAEELGLTGATSDETKSPYDPGGPLDPARAEADKLDAMTGKMGAVDLAQQGLTLGLSDNASGVGAAIAGVLRGDLGLARNYHVGRDAHELRLEDARKRLGVFGTASELAGGFGLPASALASGVGSAVKGGALSGFIGGAGYGETSDSALLGAAAGGVLGYGGARIGNALANRPSLGPRAAELDAAGRAEGITVNRAMIDPQSNNAISKTDATLIGGRRVQREMSNIEGQIEGRVTDLGRGGNAMLDTAGNVDRVAVGDKVRGAGERFIDKSGKAAKAKYDRAERLAGDAKVPPAESVALIDDMIGKMGGAKDTGLLDAAGNPIVRVEDASGLSEIPTTNANEINFLKGLRSDFSKDLSVGALRRQRTLLRQKISKGELTFGEDEARVLSIMDAASNDIEQGLIAQGKGDAAQAFRRADTAYRARMEYISGTLQKLLGKRQSQLSAEQVAAKFNSLAGNDARGLRKFYATLDPEEQADVAATFAEQLGTNAKDGFTVAQFMRQTGSKSMSDEAMRTIFGPQGAQSIRNLRTIGREVERVTGAMNSRTSKSGVANFRDWLWTAGTGLLSGATQGVSGTAIAATGAVAGATVAKQAITARLLMSPKITKWLAQAPATTNPAAIDRHFARLTDIAKVEPQLASDIDGLRQAIIGAANDNAVLPTQAAANERQDNGGQ